MHKELQEIVALTKNYVGKLKDSGITEIESFLKVPTLEDFHAKIKNCQKCDLAKTRNNFVFGEGDSNAELIFVGEAPGHDEDMQGRPFVGRAGQLLTKIIEAMGFKRNAVFICNVLKCRPPNNRAPGPDEIKMCFPYLEGQINLLKNKKIICTLGSFAAQTLLNKDLPIGKMRGSWYDYKGTALMVTYHPAYLLRNPDEKKKVWADMKKVMECLRK